MFGDWGRCIVSKIISSLYMSSPCLQNTLYWELLLTWIPLEYSVSVSAEISLPSCFLNGCTTGPPVTITICLSLRVKTIQEECSLSHCQSKWSLCLSNSMAKFPSAHCLWYCAPSSEKQYFIWVSLLWCCTQLHVGGVAVFLCHQEILEY